MWGEMAKKSLTAVFVKNVKGPSKHYDRHGLVLIVSKSGSRRWGQRVTLYGKRVDLGLGNVDFTSLSNAREIAFENKALCRQGIDPRSQNKSDVNCPNYKEAANRTHAEHASTWKNPKDRAAFLSTQDRYIFPKFGHLPVDSVTSSHIRSALLETRNLAPTVAKKLESRLRLVFKWAIAEGFRKDNPALSELLALPKMNYVVTHHKSLHYSKVAECVETVKACKAASATKWALEFLIHTASRSGEVRGAIWDEFDLEQNIPIWIIPATRMKMKRVHRVPLTPRSVEILKEAKAASHGGKIVFEGMKHDRPMSDMTLSKLVKSLGFDANVHGFRASFRTWVQEQTEYAPELGEVALAHSKSSSVEAAYARSDLFEKRYTMMQEWSSYISNEVENGER